MATRPFCPPRSWRGSACQPNHQEGVPGGRTLLPPLLPASSVRLAAPQPRFDLVALDLASRTAGKLGECHEHEVLRLLVAREVSPTASKQPRARERRVLARDDRNRHSTPRRIGS